MRISFLIPVFNEAESLRELHAEILAAVNSLPGNINRERRTIFETPLTEAPVPASTEASPKEVYSFTLPQKSQPAVAPVIAVTEPGVEPVQTEIIFIDDGSTDESWSVIKDLSQQHDETSGIRFRRNFGKASALAAGFQSMTGEIVMTLDADLQDDPAEAW